MVFPRPTSSATSSPPVGEASILRTGLNCHGRKSVTVASMLYSTSSSSPDSRSRARVRRSHSGPVNRPDRRSSAGSWSPCGTGSRASSGSQLTRPSPPRTGTCTRPARLRSPSRTTPVRAGSVRRRTKSPGFGCMASRPRGRAGCRAPPAPLRGPPIIVLARVQRLPAFPTPATACRHRIPSPMLTARPSRHRPVDEHVFHGS